MDLPQLGGEFEVEMWVAYMNRIKDDGRATEVLKVDRL
jgi:hypothetical protein